MLTENTIKKAHLIAKIVEQHYEPGRQDRCKMWVYRNVIMKIYPCSPVTYFRLLKIARENTIAIKKEIDKRQLKLFNDEEEC